jgi:hypothetical protein
MPAPISEILGDCSQTMTSARARSNAKAAASPPMPPPTTRMRGVRGIRFPPTKATVNGALAQHIVSIRGHCRAGARMTRFEECGKAKPGGESRFSQ